MRMILNAGTAEEEVYEGTPEELAEFRRQRKLSGVLLGRSPGDSPEPANSPSSPSSISPGGREYVSEEVAYRTLTRIRLSPQQRAVIVRIHTHHPDWVWATELQNTVGYSPSQFAGLMGAFGRRLTHTPGYKWPCYFFEQEWDATRECNRYRLPDSVRTAVARAGLI